MSGSFVCPVCMKPRRTLREILTCHPAMLRAMTEELDHGSVNLRLTGLLGGDAPPALRRRASERLAQQEAQP